jgi:hypothetical protein
MLNELGERLRTTVGREALQLASISEDEARRRAAPDTGWSRKEELGHLVDSATNNHVRFVCGSVDPTFVVTSYAQNDWVSAHGYADLPWPTLIDFWHKYNLLLAHLVERIPPDRLANELASKAGEKVTVRFLIEDYIVHMQHHLDRILGRHHDAWKSASSF